VPSRANEPIDLFSRYLTGEIFSYRSACGANAAASQRLRNACLDDLCALRRVVAQFGIDAQVDMEFSFTYSTWIAPISK
jgi:hypothetical protein